MSLLFSPRTIFVDIVISSHLAQASKRARGAYGGITISTSFEKKTSLKGFESRSFACRIYTVKHHLGI